MFRIIGIFFIVFLLSACVKNKSGIDISRLNCPETGLIHGAENMRILDKKGEVNTNIKLHDFIGSCSFENKEKTSVMIEVELTFHAKLLLNFSENEIQNFEYFVTVLSPDDNILIKKIFQASIELDKETGIGILTEKIEQKIPLNKLEDAGDYKIIFGLQLTSEQFNKNYK